MTLRTAGLWALVAFCGCGGGTPNTASNPTDVPARQPESAATLDATDLAVLESAATAETELRFAEAAEFRRELRTSLAARFGPQHWAVVNCDLAIDGDERLARLHAAGDPDIARLKQLEQRTAQCVRAGSLRRALDSVTEALPVAKRVFGPGGGLPLRLQLTAGQLAADLGDWEAAGGYFDDGLRAARHMFAAAHPDLDLACFRSGVACREQGELDTAIERLVESRDMAEELNGQDAAWALRVYELGVTLHRAGRREESLSELAAAELVRKQKLGDDHPLVAECLVSQAAVLMELAQWDAAQAKLREAEPICATRTESAALGTDIQLHLATIHSSLRNFSEAAVCLDKALASLDRRLGRWSLPYAHAAYRLGLCRAFEKQFDQAEPLLRHALSVQRNLLGIDHEQTRKTLRALSELLARTGREGEADQILGEHAYTSGSTQPVTDQSP